MATKKKTVKKLGARRAPTAKKTASNKAVPKSISATLPRIGDVWPGQGGHFMGIVKGENGRPDHCLILSTDPNATLKGIYGPTKRTKDAESELDGRANTQAMAAAGSTIAQQALKLRIDGHADFYIPARHEARLLFLHGQALCSEGYHWTSTQYRADSGYAWVQGFGGGTQDLFHKDTELPVRLVRRVPFDNLTI